MAINQENNRPVFEGEPDDYRQMELDEWRASIKKKIGRTGVFGTRKNEGQPTVLTPRRMVDLGTSVDDIVYQTGIKLETEYESRQPTGVYRRSRGLG